MALWVEASADTENAVPHCFSFKTTAVVITQQSVVRILFHDIWVGGFGGLLISGGENDQSCMALILHFSSMN